MNISWGTRPSDAVGMHVAAWVLGESLMHLATVWSPAEVCGCSPLSSSKAPAINLTLLIISQSLAISTSMTS